MDFMGDADELGRDDDLPPRDGVMTSHARVLTGAGLVLAGMLTIGLFQYLAFFIYAGTSSGNSPGGQYTVYAAPTGLMCLVGGWTAWSVRRSDDLTPTLRGLAVATAVVGAVLAVTVAVGVVVAFTQEPDGF